MKKDRILLITRRIPPATSGSSIIINNLAKQFSKDEMMLCGESVYRRPNVNWGDKLPEIKYLIYALPEGWRGERWIRKIQVPLGLLKAIWYYWRFKPTKIMTVYPKQEYLLIAYLLAKITGTELYPYFHNNYVENNTGFNKKLARWLQNKVFNFSKIVYVMSDGMVELFKKHYPYLSQCKALRHTFNEEIPSLGGQELKAVPSSYAFAGNINDSCEDAARFLMNTIHQHYSFDKIQLFSPLDQSTLQKKGFKTSNMNIDLVSRDQLLDRLGDHDIMLLPHGFKGNLSREEYETIFPTKTIEYLLSKRPILYFGPANAFITRFLKEHHCAYVIDEKNENHLIEAINELKSNEGLRERLVNNALKTAEMFSSHQVVQELREDMKLHHARY